MTAIRLSLHHDRKQLAQVYRQADRIHIPDLLERESAEYVFRALREQTPWSLMHMRDGQGHAMSREEWQELANDKRAALVDYVQTTASHDFQFFYSGCFLSSAASLPEPLREAFAFLNSPTFLAFVKAVTGANDIYEADAQATLYRRGDFLNLHDDSNKIQEERRVAYVLNLTPMWRPDWGGSLQFVAPDGHIIEGYTPVFNAINLFRVPQQHFVSAVAAHAAGGRYSITGWLRAKRR